MKTCPKCGTQNTADALFCTNCGRDLSLVQSVISDAGPMPGTAKPYSPPEGHTFKASIGFKIKDSFGLLANIFVVVAVLAAIIAMFFIFRYKFEGDSLMQLTLDLLIGIAIYFGLMLLNFIIQLIFYISNGGGRIKLHLGMMVEVYCEKAIKRTGYFLAQLLSNLIPLVVISVLAIFFWLPYIYIGVAVTAINTLAYIPVYIFIMKSNKTSLVRFDAGKLSIYSKPNETESPAA